MTRQIAIGYEPPQPAALEARIAVLERRVAALTQALELLAGEVHLLVQDQPTLHEAQHDLLVRS